MEFSEKDSITSTLPQKVSKHVHMPGPSGWSSDSKEQWDEANESSVATPSRENSWQQDMGALIRSRCCLWPWQTVTQKSVTLPWGPPCTLPPRPSDQPSAWDDWCLPHSPNVASIAPPPPQLGQLAPGSFGLTARGLSSCLPRAFLQKMLLCLRMVQA